MKSPIVHVRTIKNTDWVDFAEAVGIKVSGNGLPTSTQCPLCLRDTLYIYEDRNTKSQWYHCNGCKEKGHVINLAAKIWEIDVKEAVDRLIELGVSPGTYVWDKGKQKGQVKQARLEKFWQRCCRFKNPPINHQVTRRFHLHADTFSSRTQKILGQLYSFDSYKNIEKAFHCYTRVTEAGVRYDNAKRLFKGRKWDNVMVIPRYDRPGRLCGFEFIGRVGDLKDRIIVPTAIQQGTLPRHATELGLFGLTEALETSAFGSSIIAVEDSLLALRLQVRHLASANNLLPIVGWIDGPYGLSRDAWSPLFDRKVIFWHHDINPRLLRQVMLVDGYISNPKMPLMREWYDSEAFMSYMRSTNPLDIVYQLNRTALPWREFMAEWVLESRESVVVELLRGLGRLDYDLDLFARELKPRARDRLLSLIIPQYESPQQSIRYEGKVIVQKNHSWWCVNRLGTSLERISNFTVKIERISFVDERLRYTISINCGDREIRTMEDNIEKQFANRILSILTKQKFLGEVSEVFKKSLFAIAKEFYKPEFGPRISSSSSAKKP